MASGLHDTSAGILITDPVQQYLDQQENSMARRRHETGLKYQQRIESEQLRDRRPEPPPEPPVLPSVTQLLETAAPPARAPHESYEPTNPRTHEP